MVFESIEDYHACADEPSDGLDIDEYLRDGAEIWRPVGRYSGNAGSSAIMALPNRSISEGRRTAMVRISVMAG